MKLQCLFFAVLFVLGTSSAHATDDNTETAGDVLRIVIPAIAYGSTWYMDDKEGRIQFYKAFLANTVVTFGLKFAIDKERPDGSDNNSFPSGHTSYAMQGASFVHLRYGWQYAVPLYFGTAYVAYSRVHSEKHYELDVLAGAAVGFLSTYFFTTPYKGVTITPIAESGFYGLSFEKTW